MADGARVPLMSLGAAGLRERLGSGALSAEELAEACIARTEARNGEIRAFAWFDPEFVRHQARALDMHRRSGRPLGRLHGLPVALKDIIDTARIPTENGCALDAGRVPREDAWVVERLKAEGAVIFGKATTTELAFMHPSPARNPHDPSRTPGGSSAGSAAAVADGMVPLAVGTQTGGSVIRPASFCGVTGFKPTFGAIPRRGVLEQSRSLDTLGVFAADPMGAAMLAEALFGHDAADPATAPRPFPRLAEVASGAPPLRPVFAVVRPPGWERASEEMREGMAALAEALGESAFEVELPAIFEEAAGRRRTINLAEMARAYHRYGRDADRLGPETAEAIREGEAVMARDYIAALEFGDVLADALGAVLERCDAILTPAALGPAPAVEVGTGDPVFNGLWTLCGMPAATVPILTSPEGLPMGVQLAAAREGDARLMRTARWLHDWAADPDDGRQT